MSYPVILFHPYIYKDYDFTSSGLAELYARAHACVRGRAGRGEVPGQWRRCIVLSK